LGLLDKRQYSEMHRNLKQLAKSRVAYVTYARFFSAIGRR
jgi:hypothetical protein